MEGLRPDQSGSLQASDGGCTPTGIETNEHDEKCHWRQMMMSEEGTLQMEWWTKRSKFLVQHKRMSVCCDQRNESYFEVVPHEQEAPGFSAVESGMCS